MKDKYINDTEPMIINWLKSDSENATVLACEIAEYVQEQVNLCDIPFVSKSAKSPKSELNKCSFWNKVGWWLVKQTCNHESKRLISFDHCERLRHQQCNICGEEFWVVD